MFRIMQTIKIGAPVKAVFDYVREPINLTRLCPNLVHVECVEQLANGGAVFKWEYKMAHVHFYGTSRRTECIVGQCLKSTIEGGLTGTLMWVFQGEDDSTYLTLMVEYDVPQFFLQKHGQQTVLSENEAVVHDLLEHLKARLEQVAATVI